MTTNFELSENAKFHTVVSMDKRGQVIIGKETRELAKVTGGGKFAVYTIENADSNSFPLLLINVDDLDMRKAAGPALGAAV